VLSRAVGLLLGYAADSLFGDPARGHPVAGFGTVATALERRTYADRRAAGVFHVAALVGTLTAAAFVAERRLATRPVLHSLATALATWTVLGGTSLEREAHLIAGMLERGDLAGARKRLTHLVGRDTSELDDGEVARAVVESVAENTSDAVVAPLVLGALLGIPGLLGHRAANTLDAMVGHRSERYQEFGWAAARLDDLVNVPGATLTAVLATLLGPDRGGGG
jgi:adenosylcobinamide-phosphate synthase